MDHDTHDTVTRRRVLGLLGAGTAVALAGCAGGDTNTDEGEPNGEPDPTPDEPSPTSDGPELTPDEPSPTSDGSSPTPTAGDQPEQPDTPGGPGTDDGDAPVTSPGGTCGTAFGDTDTRYDPGGNWVVTFAHPSGGEVINRTRNTVTFGYPAGAGGQYDHAITVNQRGPYSGDADVGATRLENEPQFEDGGTVSYQGSERTVAVVRSDYAVVWVIGIQGPDGVYELQAQSAVRMGEPCPEAYQAACERVMTSFQPQ